MPDYIPCPWCGRPMRAGWSYCGERCALEAGRAQEERNREWMRARAAEQAAQAAREAAEARRRAMQRAPKKGPVSRLSVSGVSLRPDPREEKGGWGFPSPATYAGRVFFGRLPSGLAAPDPSDCAAGHFHLHVETVANAGNEPTGTLRFSLRILESAREEADPSFRDPDWSLPLVDFLAAGTRYDDCTVPWIPLAARVAGRRPVHFAVEELNEDGAWHVAGGIRIPGTVPLRAGRRSAPGPVSRRTSAPAEPAPAEPAGAPPVESGGLWARPGPSSQVALKGCSWASKGGWETIEAQAASVRNGSPWDTGSLKFVFWLCRGPFGGGELDGAVQMGEAWAAKPPLGRGRSLAGVSVAMRRTGNPPTGEYRAVLTVNERNADGRNYIVGWCNFPKPVRWTHR